MTGVQTCALPISLSRAGFQVDVNQQETSQAPAGQVIDQSPGGGTAAPGSTVTIVVAVAPGVPQVDVPNVVGMTRHDAERDLRSLGFNVQVNGEQSPQGKVVNQSPPGGTSAPEGSTVTIDVGPP